jgi:hypothetical protein
MIMQHASIDRVLTDQSAADDDPIIAPLLREQLEPLLGGQRDGGVGGPERALMRAMLQDAVLCLVGEAAPANEKARLAADARYWVTSRSRAWLFAFENVCDALGIDAGYARAHLLRLADRQPLTDAAASDTDQPRCERTILHGMHGLRKGGSRPRRAIHFMSERRRRRQIAPS